MNRRTRALVGLLCLTGLATGQLNQSYRPEFFSPGQGFQSVSAQISSSNVQQFKRQAPGGGGGAGAADVIPHDQKKQTTFWWVAPDTPFKATKIGGGVQKPPESADGQDGAAGAAAGGAAAAGAAGVSQTAFQTSAARTTSQAGQAFGAGGTATSIQSASRTVGTQTQGFQGAGVATGAAGSTRTSIAKSSTSTFGQTGVTQPGVIAGSSRTSSTTSSTQVNTGTTQPGVGASGVLTSSVIRQSKTQTTTGVAPVPVPPPPPPTTSIQSTTTGVRTDTITTNVNQPRTSVGVTNVDTQRTNTNIQTNLYPGQPGQPGQPGSSTTTTVVGTTGTRTIGTPPNNYGGTSVTKTQNRSDSGITSKVITTGTIQQPFFKQTTVSTGYQYPVPDTVPCYEPNKICAPNQYCNNGLVEESQLNLFNTNNQNCNSATEQCCKIRQTPATRCPDESYVCVSPSLCNNGLVNFDAQNAISTSQQTGECYAPEVCCKQQSLLSESTVLTNEGYVVKVPENQYLPPEGQNTVTNIQTAPPPRPPTTPRPPPPPPTTRYVPPPTTTRYVPPPTTTRYVPPPTTTRYYPPPTTRPPFRGDEYIPPREEVPAPSNDDPNKIRPPQDEIPNPANETPVVLRPTTLRPFQPRPDDPQAPAPLPPVGCSAAMNCTEEEFCSSTGVISKTPVVLTEEQKLFRVPVTACRNLERNFVGVCCRDPDYVDPWPVGQLGQYNPEILGFDDGSYKPNGNNGNTVNGNGNARRPGEPIQASPSQVTSTQSFAPNQFVSQTASVTQSKSQYDRGVTASASFQSTVGQRVNAAPAGLQFTNSGNTRFRPFQNQRSESTVTRSQQCAPRNYNTQPRGAGPLGTGFGEFPWQAMVLLETNKSLLCGGAIISDNTVVTAANCVYGLNPRTIQIKGGEWRLGVDAEPKTFQIVRVKDIVYHPAYNPTTLNYDVAMLVLEDRLKFDTHIGAICLDENDVVPSASYENCVTTGWGKEVLKIHIQNALMQQMSISLLSEAESQSQLQANGFTAESHICGRPSGDACEVDVGSALACADTSGTYYLKGVYSADNGCNRPDQIVSFSNIDVQWLKQALKNPNQFITPVPSYQTAANSPQVTRIQLQSTQGPAYNNKYLPPY
ncbi:inactive serine protease scarface-like [Anopheles nili]|uniref:inactive serine protease scarface-like n=1 Tax=Anopheles nili TaxID=185578 RepID=UPI00237C4816|nr:inactive serine protease scarface-like [Anopheles nili]